MTKDEALRLALEALKSIDEAMPFPVAKLAIKECTAALEAKDEPVAWNTGIPPLYPKMKEGETISVEYVELTPPQRTWIGLTEDEIEASKPTRSNDAVVWELAVEWAEAKLKEKNSG
jgi:hypothetical protein